MTTHPTYTRREAMHLLGIQNISAFHQLRKRRPTFIVVVHQGTGRLDPTTYDKTQLDKLIALREAYRTPAS